MNCPSCGRTNPVDAPECEACSTQLSVNVGPLPTVPQMDVAVAPPPADAPVPVPVPGPEAVPAPPPETPAEEKTEPFADPDIVTVSDASSTSFGTDETVVADVQATVVGGVYVLEEMIGEGGMGRVFMGRHRLTEQIVAVKMLPPEFAEDPGFRNRFVSEAKALATLAHPNIVRMHTFLEEYDRFFLIMDYIEGEDLKEKIEREGRLTIRDVLSISRQVLAALHHAHEQGVIHRDVKPGNIRVQPNGIVKVMDLGVAQILTGEAKGIKAGSVVGTHQYMSPEQARGRSVDSRSDLYAFGCTMFEMLTGSVPFPVGSAAQARKAHIQWNPPEVDAMRPDTPAAVAASVMLALSKRPEDRPASADAFRRAMGLAPVLAPDPSSVDDPERKETKKAIEAVPEEADGHEDDLAVLNAGVSPGLVAIIVGVVVVVLVIAVLLSGG